MAADNIVHYLNVPSLIKGAILVAVASSFPEFATVVLSTWKHGVFDLGVGTIVGSAVFSFSLRFTTIEERYGVASALLPGNLQWISVYQPSIDIHRITDHQPPCITHFWS